MKGVTALLLVRCYFFLRAHLEIHACSFFHSNTVWLFPTELRFITNYWKHRVTTSPLCDKMLALCLVYSIGQVLRTLSVPWRGAVRILCPAVDTLHTETLRACSPGPRPRFPLQPARLSPVAPGQLPGGPGSPGEGMDEGGAKSLLIEQQSHNYDNSWIWAENRHSCAAVGHKALTTTVLPETQTPLFSIAHPDAPRTCFGLLCVTLQSAAHFCALEFTFLH